MNRDLVRAFEDGRQPRQDFIENVRRDSLNAPAAAGSYIERSWLIASNDSSCARAGKRNSEAGNSGKSASRRDGNDHGGLGESIKLCRGDDQYWPGALLLLSCGWIARNDVNVALLHNNSRPTGRAFNHSLSSLERRAWGLHSASKSSRV